eukprot:2084688-Rhodomonas_salina.1
MPALDVVRRLLLAVILLSLWHCPSRAQENGPVRSVEQVGTGDDVRGVGARKVLEVSAPSATELVQM